MIKITKRLNLLELEPASKLVHLLAPELTFRRVAMNYGRGGRISSVPELLYQHVGDRIITFAGLADRVFNALKGYRLEYTFTELDPVVYPEPVWDNLVGVNLREPQIRMLPIMTSYPCAQLNGCTGLGKTFMITQFAKLYPHKDFGIIICAQQLPVVRAIYRSLLEVYPEEVGRIGGGMNRPARITVTTARSLLKAPVDDCKVLIYDEVHTAAAPSTSRMLIKFKRARMFGLSASTECRTDRADLLTEAIFGPVRLTVSYSEAADAGYVASVSAYFYRIEVPICTAVHKVTRKRRLVWRNQRRNQQVARVVRYWLDRLDNPQILVMTDALEHVMRLKQLLPEFELMYADCSARQLRKFDAMGILPAGFKPMSAREQEELQLRIEEGEVRRVISTTTLGTGVDLRNLDVFVRADGGSSEVSNIQFRGRLARGSRGIYCDFLVSGDPNEASRSAARYRSCTRAGWKMEKVDLP